ncbi:hypothetical protein GCM10011374_32490 [Kocuria dechangensis]|uniref:Uncharacterized protein n=1 Tax=Kocuria dechangensis TaxID=1176249 RepID=A0A917H2L7_9MICC|nr:hypothetical protein GCM10011374_32490 [Kocuria dechangensis]
MARLLTVNADGSYSIRIPSEDDRIITVPDGGNAEVVARAAAARTRLGDLQPARRCRRRRCCRTSRPAPPNGGAKPLMPGIVS